MEWSSSGEVLCRPGESQEKATPPAAASTVRALPQSAPPPDAPPASPAVQGRERPSELSAALHGEATRRPKGRPTYIFASAGTTPSPIPIRMITGAGRAIPRHRCISEPPTQSPLLPPRGVADESSTSTPEGTFTRSQTDGRPRQLGWPWPLTSAPARTPPTPSVLHRRRGCMLAPFRFITAACAAIEHCSRATCRPICARGSSFNSRRRCREVVLRVRLSQLVVPRTSVVMSPL